MSEHSLTLVKSERLCSRSLIGTLFSEGKSVAAFPIRIVYRISGYSDEKTACKATAMFSVSKRHFKRAVCRNRVKRQLREMYRHSKSQIAALCSASGKDVQLAFIFADNRLWESDALAVKFGVAFEKLLSELRQDSETVGQ